MIDINKQYRTRDGREVRLYATDGEEHAPIHGAVKSEFVWFPFQWKGDGTGYVRCGELDLIEVKPRIKRTVWQNIIKDTYGDLVFSTYHTKAEADRHHYDRRIACVKIEIDCEEGDGL